MKNIKVVISTDNEHAVSDWSVTSWCEGLQEGDTAYVATSRMLDEVRIGISRQEIAPVNFDFEGFNLSIGSKGEIKEGWPSNFFDHQAIQLKQLMTGKDKESATRSVEEFKSRRGIFPAS